MLSSSMESGAAFSAIDIWAGYEKFVRKVIRHRIKDRNQADDIFQNVFLTFIIKPISTDTEDIIGHVYRTTSNCITSHKRKTACYQRHLNTFRYLEKMQLADIQNDPQDMLIDTEETIRMFSFIRKQLSQQEGQAITLRYLNDLEFCEIAGIMHVKVLSVRRYIARALKKLRDSLTPADLIIAAE